jgi:hypothetical protein
MKTKLKFLFSMATVLMLLVGITGVALADVHTDLQVYSSGDTVYITGDGMNAGEGVGIDVGFPDSSLAQHHDVVADDNGNFADSYVVPIDPPTGIYTVTATGADSGNSFSTTFDPPTPIQQTVTWTGNGTTNGYCNAFIDDPNLNPGPGQQGWLFILSSPFDNTGSNLSFSFDDGTASPPTVAGFFQGGGAGSYHFIVYTTLGAKLLSASATNGTQFSNLTVSHCESGGSGAKDLTVSKTATPSFTRTFNWTIDKSADKDTVYSAGGGTSGAVHFTVAVTKDTGTDSDFVVSGTITVHNPNTFDVNGVDVSDSTPNGTCSVTSSSVDVPAGGDATADYTCTFTSNPGSDTNTATATWDASAYGTPSGSASGTKDYTFGDPTTVVNDTITVTDTNGGSWPFSASGSVSYDQTYTDPAAGTCTSHENTATITGGASDSVTVQDCQGANLTVTKTATPSFDLTYAWTIDKSVDKTSVKQVGGSATFNYTVSVLHDAGTPGNWQVNGTITVHNPNDFEPVTLTGVTDAVDDGGTCTVSGNTTQTIAAGGDSTGLTYNCTYASAPDPSDGTNTATATWDKDAAHTTADSADGTAPVNFSTTSPNLVDECVTVTDSFKGALGTACVGVDPNPKTFTYQRIIAVTPGCHSYDNTATFTTNDTHSTGSDSQTVEVCGPAQTGALTIGFWKTTNGQNLIKTYCNNSGNNLGTYLATLGPTDQGPFSNAPTGCAALNTYIQSILNGASATNMNVMLKAQMMGTALDVWFSGPGWTSTVVSKIKAPSNFLSHNNLGTFNMDTTAVCPMVDNTTTGTATCLNSLPSTDAFASGAVPSSPMSMQAILDFAATTPSPFNGSTSNSIWYGGNRTKQEILKNIFDQFNNQMAFGSF